MTFFLIKTIIQEIKVDQGIISLVANHVNGIPFAQVLSLSKLPPKKSNLLNPL